MTLQSHLDFIVNDDMLLVPLRRYPVVGFSTIVTFQTKVPPLNVDNSSSVLNTSPVAQQDFKVRISLHCSTSILIYWYCIVCTDVG